MLKKNPARNTSGVRPELGGVAPNSLAAQAIRALAVAKGGNVPGGDDQGPIELADSSFDVWSAEAPKTVELSRHELIALASGAALLQYDDVSAKRIRLLVGRITGCPEVDDGRLKSVARHLRTSISELSQPQVKAALAAFDKNSWSKSAGKALYAAAKQALTQGAYAVPVLNGAAHA